MTSIHPALSIAHLSIDIMFRTALQTVRPQARAFSASALRAAGSVNYNDVKPLTKQPTDVSLPIPQSQWLEPAVQPANSCYARS